MQVDKVEGNMFAQKQVPPTDSRLAMRSPGLQGNYPGDHMPNRIIDCADPLIAYATEQGRAVRSPQPIRLKRAGSANKRERNNSQQQTSQPPKNFEH